MRNRDLKAPKGVDVYALYEQAVQDSAADTRWFARVFRELHGFDARRLREDFCGTFRTCCAWVQRHPRNHAVGVDIDSGPLDYGRRRHLTRLTPAERRRLLLLRKDVLEVGSPRVDLVVACNFSYWTFKTRDRLRRYFRAAFRSLRARGLLLVDATGGPAGHDPHVEWRFLKSRSGRRKFTYLWDQKTYNPITQESRFAIHFKLPDGTRVRDAFLYDWRLWTIPELREVMREAGFRETFVYWEGDDPRTGGGNGVFTRTEAAEPCESWIAFVAGKKG